MTIAKVAKADNSNGTGNGIHGSLNGDLRKCTLPFSLRDAARSLERRPTSKSDPQKIPFRRAIQTYRVLGFVGRSPTFQCAVLRALCRQDPLTWQPKREARGPRMERQIAEPRCALERGESKIEDCGKRGACDLSRIESGPFDAPGAFSPTKPSKYEPAFKQGATILPRSFYSSELANWMVRLMPAPVLGGN